jgi:hypothetical protein
MFEYKFIQIRWTTGDAKILDPLRKIDICRLSQIQKRSNFANSSCFSFSDRVQY